jgi:hypothetical protein
VVFVQRRSGSAQHRSGATLPLPISSLKSGFPVLGNPANRNRAVPLSCFDQFLYAFANAVSETRGSSCTKPTQCRHLANHCSKQPQPTRTRGARRRWTPTTPSGPAADHLRGKRPYRAAGGRQRLLQAAGQPRRHRRSSRSRTVDMPSPSTAAGAKSPTPPLPSSTIHIAGQKPIQVSGTRTHRPWLGTETLG